MTYTYKVLGQGASNGSGDVTIYTVPSSKQCAVSLIRITNVSASQNKYNLSFVKSADSSNSTSPDKSIAIYNKTIDSKETYQVRGGITLSAGDQIRVYSSSSDIVVNVYGVEIS